MVGGATFSVWMVFSPRLWRPSMAPCVVSWRDKQSDECSEARDTKQIGSSLLSFLISFLLVLFFGILLPCVLFLRFLLTKVPAFPAERFADAEGDGLGAFHLVADASTDICFSWIRACCPKLLVHGY